MGSIDTAQRQGLLDSLAAQLQAQLDNVAAHPAASLWPTSGPSTDSMCKIGRNPCAQLQAQAEQLLDFIAAAQPSLRLVTTALKPVCAAAVKTPTYPLLLGFLERAVEGAVAERDVRSALLALDRLCEGNLCSGLVPPAAGLRPLQVGCCWE